MMSAIVDAGVTLFILKRKILQMLGVWIQGLGCKNSNHCDITCPRKYGVQSHMNHL